MLEGQTAQLWVTEAEHIEYPDDSLAGWNAGERTCLSSRSKKGNGWREEGSGEDNDWLGRKAIMVTLWTHISPASILPVAPW